jgi:SAM-dependent methyltransferase
MLPDILPRINGRRIGLLLDGPKGAEALKLAMNAFSLNAEVAVACIHDMRRDTAQRALAMSSPVRSFFTDESAYRRAYAGLDRGCLPTGEITIHTWRPYKKGHEDIPAYGPTLGVFLPRPSSSRRLPQSTPSTPVAQERGGDAGGSGSRGLVATGGVTVAKPVTVTRPARTISTPNRFLHSADLLHPAMERLQTEFEEVYRDELKGRPHPSHARSPEGVVMHWSRAWEYPWTVMHGDFAPGMRVVDLGCGGSPLIPFLAWRVGCACTGVDLNLVSREGHTLRGFDGPPEKHVPEAEWVQADMTSTGLPAESFDRVLCISVLEHLEEETAAKALGEMRRLLAPGGRVLVTTDVDGAHRTLKVDYRRLVELAAGHGLVLAGARELDAPESPAATREGHRGTYDVVGMVFEEVSEPHRVA